MEKVYGSPKRQDGLYKVGRNTWELIYGFGKDQDGDETGWNWRQRFRYKPTEEEVKNVIIAQIDTNTDSKILTGFKWKGVSVWLSTENQMNYKAAYDLAVQMGGGILPIKFKLGEDESGNAQYHTFEALEEFTDFYTKAVMHVTTCLNEGWKEKDGVNVQEIINNG